MNVKGLHIELTNKCYLKCPKCPRTLFIDKFGIKNWENYDLKLEHLKSFLNIDLTDKIINFCGNYGDSIYHPEFLDIVKWFKEQNSLIKIVTNGSYKNKIWWENLTGLLSENDEICFSIDGIPENFTNYRINADWKSISVGLDVVGNSQVHSAWKYIPFNFNEFDIESAKKISDSFNINEFRIEPSYRFEETDDLIPESDKKIHVSTVAKIHWQKLDQFSRKDQLIDPECKSEGNHFISADGYYLPCCYVGDYRFYYKSKFYKNKKSYKIQDTTIEKILEQEDNFFKNLEVSKLDYCTYNCPKL